MRMFLVGMCDIFLILYLTQLSTVDQRRVSGLTVADYKLLEQERNVLDDANAELAERARALAEKERMLEQALMQRESEIASLAESSEEQRAAAETQKQRRLELEEQLAAERSALAALDTELSRARQEQDASEEQRQVLERQREAAERKLQQASAERERALAEQQTLHQELEQLGRARAAAEKRIEAERQARAEAEEAAEQARRLIEEARLEAERAQQEAQRAQHEAELAARRADSLQKKADAARLAESIALHQKQQAQQVADEARQLARSAGQQAERAAVDARRARSALAETTEEMLQIVQPAERAFKQNVEPRLVSVRSEIRRDTLLGIGGEQVERLSAVAVSIGSEQFAFIPLGLLGIDLSSGTRNFERFSLTIDDVPVSEIYLRTRSPHVLAAVLPSKRSGARAAANDTDPREFTPTLMAIRGGRELGFFDRLRDLDDSLFVFKRGHLRRGEGGTLRYEPSGIRGTGDYAEYIMLGDQVVNPKGEWIGLATERNEILPISGVDGWQKINIEGRSARWVMGEMARAARSGS